MASVSLVFNFYFLFKDAEVWAYLNANGKENQEKLKIQERSKIM